MLSCAWHPVINMLCNQKASLTQQALDKNQQIPLASAPSWTQNSGRYIYMAQTSSPDTSAPWRRRQRWSLKRWFFCLLTNWHSWQPDNPRIFYYILAYNFTIIKSGIYLNLLNLSFIQKFHMLAFKIRMYVVDNNTHAMYQIGTVFPMFTHTLNFYISAYFITLKCPWLFMSLFVSLSSLDQQGENLRWKKLFLCSSCSVISKQRGKKLKSFQQEHFWYRICKNVHNNEPENILYISLCVLNAKILPQSTMKDSLNYRLNILQMRKSNSASRDHYKISLPLLLWLLNKFRKHWAIAVYLPHRFGLWTQMSVWLYWSPHHCNWCCKPLHCITFSFQFPCRWTCAYMYNRWHYDRFWQWYKLLPSPRGLLCRLWFCTKQ
jgi:hypothetical protein